MLKVNVPRVQALRLCTVRTAHWGSRGIAVPFHDHGTRGGWGVSVTPRPLFTPGKNPLYMRLGGPQGRSGQVRKISSPTGIRSPDRPARSQSLYRLRYPAHLFRCGTLKIHIHTLTRIRFVNFPAVGNTCTQNKWHEQPGTQNDFERNAKHIFWTCCSFTTLENGTWQESKIIAEEILWKL